MYFSRPKIGPGKGGETLDPGVATRAMERVSGTSRFGDQELSSSAIQENFGRRGKLSAIAEV